MELMKSLSIAISLLFFLTGFTTDEVLTYEKALKRASEENKEVLLVFSGSDWCKPCILLRRNVLNSEDFKTYASGNLVVLDLDFPYKKSNQLPKEQQEHNERMAEKFNPNGAFPRVVLLDASGNQLGEIKTSKSIGPTEFIDQLKHLSQ
jgi:thioredoxin-related protein